MAEIVSVEREIKSPPQNVWDLVTNIARMGDWSPEATGGAWLGGAQGPAPGARFRGTNRAGWRRWWTTCTVTEAQPGRSFVFRAASGPLVISDWAYRIEPTENGCRVTETWTDRRGGLIKFFGTLVSGVADRPSHNREGMETTLERIAATAEA